MPGVDTIEALTAAAQAFDATPLGLQVDPDTEAAVRESLQRTGLVLLVETHGVAHTPVLLEELIAWYGLGGIAPGWNEDLWPWLDRWIAHGLLVDPVCGPNLAGEVWGGDGRLTAGHLAVLPSDHPDGRDDCRAPAPGGERQSRWIGDGGASGTLRWPAGFWPHQTPVAGWWCCAQVYSRRVSTTPRSSKSDIAASSAVGRRRWKSLVNPST